MSTEKQSSDERYIAALEVALLAYRTQTKAMDKAMGILVREVGSKRAEDALLLMKSQVVDSANDVREAVMRLKTAREEYMVTKNCIFVEVPQ